MHGFSLNEGTGWKVKQEITYQGLPLILDVSEVGPELIPGGIEEWEGGKSQLMFLYAKGSRPPKGNLHKLRPA